jgi:O-antigen/teichoic acid export membrane protein
MNRVLLISAFILLSVSLFSPELILILGGEKYKTGIYVIPPITSSTLFIILYLLTSNIEFLYGKTHRIAIMTIVAAILNIVLNWLLIPRFGYIAAAYTTLAAFAIYSFLHLNNMYSLYGKMNNKFTIFVIITCSVVLCISSIYLFEYNIIRYCLIVLLLTCCILYYRKIKA